MADGTLLERGETAVTVQCDANAAAISEGAKVVLIFESGKERWTGIVDTVESHQGQIHLRVKAPSAHEADKRDYPRLHAGLPIRYRIGDAADADRWLSGSAIEDNWHTPDPYMNFSVSGLRFDVDATVQEGNLLLISLCVGDTGHEYRVTASVIRIFEGDGSVRRAAAVSFESLPEDALAALSDLTLQIQETLL